MFVDQDLCFPDSLCLYCGLYVVVYQTNSELMHV